MTAPLSTLHVELGTRRYPILIGDGILSEQLLPLLHESLPQHGRNILVLSNPTVAGHYLNAVLHAFQNHDKAYNVHHMLIPDGESYKSLATYSDVMDVLVKQRFDRDCVIIALGGGVVGDLAGFVAATWQRGVQCLQIPTTLLAQVDSSVGGKTAVNHPGGKNLIGAFHQPAAVLIDTQVLTTLPDRELGAGIAEIIKYGIMADAEFFRWLQQNMQPLLDKDPQALAHAIHTSCAIKARVVAADETEQGQRALLNLGHTFGHAIEAATQYSSWLHGEAVATGMVMAARLSCLRGFIGTTYRDAIIDLIQSAHLPTVPPIAMSIDTWLELMSRDKKVKDGTMRFILPTGPGAAEIFSNVTQAELTRVINESIAQA
ncbi:3-dehydroquinate synthase [Aliidiomarina indica]|uniref:3-dehydroquinate synthase n=1 Tax=Aliidiomarina indica TaxID=2749147 RepID=UPI00188EBBC3|nr:3-dehydroquinate synthase [Aliidiomarina indica]